MEKPINIVLEDATARCSGAWVAHNMDMVEMTMAQLPWPSGMLRFDLGEVESIDTAGAWILLRTIESLRAIGQEVAVTGASAQIDELLKLIAARDTGADDPPKPYLPGFLESVGRHTGSQLTQYLGFLKFIGQLAMVTGRAATRPWNVRWALVVKELRSAGVNALPIVGLLSFLIGVVIAYQGGIVLRDYGANIYVADIVGLSMVRELAPLITAIIVAGRTGSAYTAQIGTMMVTEEVDALRSIGIAPMEMLVLPKLIALVVALPLLTVFADVMGLFGGLVMSGSMLDLNSTTFINRLAGALTLNSYLSGVGKAPVFAAIIAIVGCFQGFRVYGSAGSVGKQTTVSVVQSIFLVIIVDAAFSVAFSKLGI